MQLPVKSSPSWPQISPAFRILKQTCVGLFGALMSPGSVSFCASKSSRKEGSISQGCCEGQHGPLLRLSGSLLVPDAQPSCPW